MAKINTNKEALFNEVKGSLFEFLVGKELASLSGEELGYLQSIDKNYLNVLSQQDRMVRQFYPEMLSFLTINSKLMASELSLYFKEVPLAPKLLGKFSNSPTNLERHEADLAFQTKAGEIPLSLKLNKKNAHVNTKSGGVKSFFSHYFPTIPSTEQAKFNELVDLEFSRMGFELHELYGMEFSGNFVNWVKNGLSELPGELEPEARKILKNYYARLAHSMYGILSKEFKKNKSTFICALPALMGFGSKDIYQAICYHEFKTGNEAEIAIHSFSDLATDLENVTVMPFDNVSSVEILIGKWSLQIRIKPMNKFTTTAMKVNCSVKIKQPSDV